METTSAVSRVVRGMPRARVHLPAAVFSNHFHAPVEVECTDLSLSGMFLSADLLLDPGERLTVSFTVPGTWHRIVADARIVRAPRGTTAGMGLHFDRLPSLDATILGRALQTVRRGSA
jgi:hypothetical protein